MVLSKAETAIRAQLAKGTAGRRTFFDMAAELAAASAGGRREAGRYGGFVGKAWCAWLVTKLTDHALLEAGVEDLATRERVRDWQRHVFGQALSSEGLVRYAKTDGYRGPDFEVPALIEARAQALFKEYRRALKERVEATALKRARAARRSAR
jgi:hypothetical protein